MTTKSEILDKEFDFRPIHLGLFLNEELWQYDKWTVIIEGQTFDYNTGIGHREPLKGYKAGGKNWRGYKDEAHYYLNGNFIKDKESLEKVNTKIKKFSKVTPLNIDDVLFSLIMDSEALEQNFFDWCDMLGYDKDSRKAERIYNDCKQNAEKVLRFIPDLDEAREKFQDY